MWGATWNLISTRPAPHYFNPRSPCGERPCPSATGPPRWKFQSTLPVWGATVADFRPNPRNQISIHAPRVGSDRTGFLCLIALLDFNPRSPCGERHLGGNRVPVNISISIHAPRVGSDIIMDAVNTFDNDFNPRSPCGERQQRCIVFSFASSAKRVFFCDILQIGRHLQGIGRKRRGDFLSRSVRTSRGKYGCLAFAFRESGGLRENRRFYSQSVLFSFRIDCQGSRILGCPFRGP